jgi:uncharacterized membrane protein
MPSPDPTPLARAFARLRPALGREGAAVGLLLLLAFAYSAAITIYRVHNFLTFYPIDTGVPTQAVWNAFGRVPFLQTLNDNGWCELSYHSYPLLLALLPALWVFPTGLVLLLAKNALLLAAVVPLVLIARQCGAPRGTRLAIAVLYLGAPFVHGFAHLEVHHGIFGLPFLALGWHAYRAGALRRLLACLLACMLCKESYAFTACAFALLAALDRRPLRWAVLLFGLGAGYFAGYSLLKHFVFVPLSATKLNLFANLYGSWGDSFGNCVRGMLGHPWRVLGCVFSPSRWFYLAYLAFPFLPFLLLRPRLLLLAAPHWLIVALMTGRGEEVFHFGMSDYFGEILLLAFIATVEAISERKWNARRETALAAALCALAAFSLDGALHENTLSEYLTGMTGLDKCLSSYATLAVLAAASYLLLLLLAALREWKRPLLNTGLGIAWLLALVVAFTALVYRHSPAWAEGYCFKVDAGTRARNAAARAALARVPRDASLAIPAKYAIVASARSRVYTYNGTGDLASKWYFSAREPEYVLVDVNNYNTIFDALGLNQTWDRSHAVKLVNDRARWDLVASHDGIVFLLKRRG